MDAPHLGSRIPERASLYSARTYKEDGNTYIRLFFFFLPSPARNLGLELSGRLAALMAKVKHFKPLQDWLLSRP